MAEEPASGGDASPAADDSRPRVERALREVRRECWKAAVVHAVAEAAVVFLLANLVLVTVEPSWLPSGVALPDSVSDPLADALGSPGSFAVPGSAALAAALGVFAFLVGVGIRVRRPLVEQFEAANPPVREALRTARDAVADSEGRPSGDHRSERRRGEHADSAMARRLYADVLDRLGESSGLALVDGRRIAVAVVLVVVLSVATIQVAVMDPTFLDPTEDADSGPSREPETNYTGLLDGDQVLGDSEAVEAGEEELNASIESTGGGQDVGEDRQFPAGRPSGSSGGSGVDSQQAGFAEPEQIEDAELVREYNRRIRSDGGETGSGDGGDGSGSDQGSDGDNT